MTRDLQDEWARQHVRRTGTLTAASRVEILRPFAAYYRQFEVDTEVLPTNALGRGHRRLTQHIYTDEEVLQLLWYPDGLAPLGGCAVGVEPRQAHTGVARNLLRAGEKLEKPVDQQLRATFGSSARPR